MPPKKHQKPVAVDDLRTVVDGKEAPRWTAAPVRRTQMQVQVTVIRQAGASTLVQYIQDGALMRRIVPAAEVIDNAVAEQVLAAGIPYGFPWEEIQMVFDMQKFVNELHQIDIWTAEDLLKSPQKLWSALRAALADSLSNVLEIARNEHKGARHG